MILVTGNLHKVEEFERLMPGVSWEALSSWELRERGERGAEIIEDADSFIGNAMIKAREGWRRTGQVSLADDSGLCVDALNGAPGIYSARYAPGSDRDRYEALLKNLNAVDNADRSAHFYCALAICGLSHQHRTALQELESREESGAEMGEVKLWLGDCLVVTGICRGRISAEPSGRGGFGYDPIFELSNGQSFASLTGEDKDTYSHRGRALRALDDLLREKNIHFS